MKSRITLPELVALVAQATSTTDRMSELFLRELFATVTEALIAGENVTIKDLGSFKVRPAAPGSAHSVDLTFTPAKRMAEALNQPFEAFAPIELDADIDEQELASAGDETTPADDSAIPPPYLSVQPPVAAATDNAASAIEQGSTEGAEAAHATVNGDTTGTPATDDRYKDVVTEKQSEKPLQTEGHEDVERPQSDTHAADSAHNNDSAPPQETAETADKPEGATTEPNAATANREAEPETTSTESETATVDEPELLPASALVAVPGSERDYREELLEQVHAARASSSLWKGIAIGLMVGVVAVLAIAFALRPALLKSDSAPGAPTDTVTVMPAVNEEPVAAPVVVTDTVSRTHYLTKMAMRHYGRQEFWVYIYQENLSLIRDPNNIAPGTVLVIPPAEKYGIDASDPASVARAERLSIEIFGRFRK